MNTTDKLHALRQQMEGISGLIVPVHDEFMSEYPPPCFQRVAWLCGFSGSAGTLVVLKDKAALFTDGRYTLQAAAQTDPDCIDVYNSGDIPPERWIARELKDARVGYDPALFTPSMLERMEKACATSNVVLVPAGGLVDAIWKSRPAMPATPVFLHDDKYAGESSAAKCVRLAAGIKTQGADAAFIAAPESVCWLLNIRAHDVECTPLVLARALLHANGTVELFVDSARLPKLPAHIRAAVMEQSIAALSGKKVLCDMSQLPVAQLSLLEEAGAEIIRGEDPCTLPKACKNDIQIAGIRAAHRRDGMAVARLLGWLKNHSDIRTVSEIEIADTLLAFRAEDKNFVEPSFPTIAGSGPNGAIVHYRADEQSNRHLNYGELLLIDSGGQYPDGTTDITRTVAIGNPSAEHKDRFTRVLRGHIAIATATFPKGTRGSQLDALARAPLQEIGLDYDHGTGHGVGQFLGVHEGPQRISKRGGDAELKPGMVISNEPGYYKTGEYGIRIENLVVVVEKPGGMLGFETITCAPIDETLVDFSMLSEAEKTWLRDYQTWAGGA